MRTIFFCLLAFPVAFLVVTTTVAAPPLHFEATDNPPGSAVLELQAEALVTMTAIPFRLMVKDTAGKPLTGAKVTCELTMPSMPMPENRPKVTERNGVYVGEMVLTCTMGEWRATCLVEDGKGMRRTMTFDLGTARMK